MRRGCQWVLALTLLPGCSGAPGGAPSRVAARLTADSSAAVPAMPGQMDPVAARQLLAAHPEALVLDVRNPDEWSDDLGHIEGARQIPLPELSARLAEVAAWKQRPILVVCRVGGRSRQAAEMLSVSGYRKVFNLEGGMAAWRQSEGLAPGR
jgi:sulfur-carrier protein adenylyltransferase/sulfurtransferase